MKFSKSSWVTSLGGLMYVAGWIVGATVNPVIGEAPKAGGVGVVGLFGRDNNKTSEQVGAK